MSSVTATPRSTEKQTRLCLGEGLPCWIKWVFGVALFFLLMLVGVYARGSIQEHGFYMSACGTKLRLAIVVAIAVNFPILCVFLVFLVERWQIIVDTNSKTIAVYYGPFMRRAKSILGYDASEGIQVHRELTRAGKGVNITFPVSLIGPLKPIFLTNSRCYFKSRQKAEKIASFTGLPFVDTTSGMRVIRESCYLDECVRDRIARTGETWESPLAPDGSPTRLIHHTDSLDIHIPRPGFGKLPRTALGFGLFMSLLFTLILHTSQHPFVLLVMATPLVMAVFYASWATFFKTCLTVTPKVLIISTRLLGMCSQWVFKLDDLEELYCLEPPLSDAALDALENVVSEAMEGQFEGSFIRQKMIELRERKEFQTGIILRSDDDQICLGGHLPLPEQHYLYALLMDAIAVPNSEK